MNPHYETLFKAMRYSLQGISFDEKITDPVFFRIARENGLSGMIFPYLIEDKTTPDIYQQFKTDFYAYNRIDAQQENAITSIITVLNQHNIKHIFLKGVTLKSVYPEPYMRSMGDIDLLIEEEHLNTIIPILECIGFTRTSKGDPHHNYINASGVLLEIHWRLFGQDHEQHLPFFNDAFKYVKYSNLNTYEFDEAFLMVYLLAHAAKHIISSGIGLRSVLDFGLYLKHKHPLINLSQLKMYLEETSLTRFFQNMLWLNQKYFDIAVLPEFLEDYTMSETLYETFTDYLIKSGVHGLGCNFNNFVGRLSRSKSKTHLLFLLVFPKYQSMKTSHPILEKLPILLPYFYLKRLFKLVFKRRKRSLIRLKQLNICKPTLEKTKTLYKELGL